MKAVLTTKQASIQTIKDKYHNTVVHIVGEPERVTLNMCTGKYYVVIRNNGAEVAYANVDAVSIDGAELTAIEWCSSKCSCKGE